MPGTRARSQGITISWHGIPQVTAALLKAANLYRTPGQVNRIIRPAANRLRQEVSSVTATTFQGSGTGNLARSIKTFTIRDLRAVFVGANVGGGRYPDGYYFGFQEKGTKTKAGAQRIKPKHMLERAFANKGNQVANEMANALLQELKYYL